MQYDQATATIQVVSRSGNVCVQMYHRGISTAALAQIEGQVKHAGGSVDGCDSHMLVLTFPVTAGFSSIESYVQALSVALVAEWMFGNVYDPSGEPLGWWT